MNACESCGQVVVVDGLEAGLCSGCREGAYGELEVHETQRLFVPAPEPMPGQLDLGPESS